MPVEGLRKLWPGSKRDLDDHTQDEFKHLDGTRRFLRRLDRHVLATDGHTAQLCRDLDALPEPGTACHMILDGRYPLWAFVPSILRLSGATITDIQIATLGISRDNVAQLCDLIDAGKVRGDGLHLLCSHYFAEASKDIFGPAVQVLTERGGHVHAVRTHCKVLNLSLADGRTYTVESSANLRSCKNIEQATVYTDPDLYQFHRGWIVSLFPG